MHGKRYLTRPAVRERYGGIADITVTRWILAGRISPPLLIGNRHYFDLEALDDADREHAAAYGRAKARSPNHTPPQRRSDTEAHS